jgi:hypothetical protein
MVRHGWRHGLMITSVSVSVVSFRSTSRSRPIVFVTAVLPRCALIAFLLLYLFVALLTSYCHSRCQNSFDSIFYFLLFLHVQLTKPILDFFVVIGRNPRILNDRFQGRRLGCGSIRLHHFTMLLRTFFTDSKGRGVSVQRLKGIRRNKTNYLSEE